MKSTLLVASAIRMFLRHRGYYRSQCTGDNALCVFLKQDDRGVEYFLTVHLFLFWVKVRVVVCNSESKRVHYRLLVHLPSYISIGCDFDWFLLLQYVRFRYANFFWYSECIPRLPSWGLISDSEQLTRVEHLTRVQHMLEEVPGIIPGWR